MKHKQFFKFEIFYLEFRLAKCEGYVSISYHMLKKKKKLKQNFNNIQNMFTLICLFMVIQKRVMKYITRIGQNTGILKNSKKVQAKAIVVALVAEYQNLNSGSLRMKGLNSSLLDVGRAGPSSSASYSAMAGSILGVRKASNKLR